MHVSKSTTILVKKKGWRLSEGKRVGNLEEFHCTVCKLSKRPDSTM